MPALSGILRDPYLSHWEVLVVACRRLASREMSESQLSHVATLLEAFVEQAAELYGPQVCELHLI